MQAKVIEFANLLRKSGVRVSVAEAIDAFESLDELSLDDREIFKDALRASMVKRGDEIPTYDQLFDLFWSGFYDSLQQGFGEVNSDMAQMGIDVDELLRQLAEMMQVARGGGHRGAKPRLRGSMRGAWGGRTVASMPHYALGVADFPVIGADDMEDHEAPNPTDFKLEGKPRPITSEGDWGDSMKQRNHCYGLVNGKEFVV